MPLPQSVYDDVANPAVTSISVPYGRYSMPAYFAITRSNLDSDWNGSTLYVDPADTVGQTGNGFPFFIDSTVDEFDDPLVPTRKASHLTGTITEATTQLTMDAGEIMDVFPGEIVSIVAGVNTSDPVEPYKYITAEVLSVAGQVITFTAPLGVNVTTYANEAALQAVVVPGLWDKIGPWGDDYIGANYHKGLGTDHGLLRYLGDDGMNHDITFRNLNIDTTLPSDALMREQVHHTFFVRHCLRFSLFNFSWQNFLASAIHTWNVDDVLVDGLIVRGEGRSRIFSGETGIHVGQVMSAWGGTRITYKNADIQGTNMTLGNTEVSPADVLFENVNYNVAFSRTWSYPPAATVLGFYGATLGAGVRLKNTTLEITGATEDWDIDPGNVVTFEDCVFAQAFFPDYFTFSRHLIEGTLTVNSLVYGPLVVDEETLIRTAVEGSTITPPVGFYKSIRVRATTLGSVTGIYDGFGNDYVLVENEWKVLNVDAWCKVPPGSTALANYFTNARISFHVSGGSSATLEFEASYYPRSGGAGWVMS